MKKKNSYLVSPWFTQEECSLLLRLRITCVNNIGSDFAGMYTDQNCPVNSNCKSVDTLQLLLVCEALQDCLIYHTIAKHKIVYEDIFSEDISRQKETTTLYQLLLDSRERILGTPAALWRHMNKVLSSLFFCQIDLHILTLSYS